MFENLFVDELSTRLGSSVVVGTEDQFDPVTGVLASVSANVIVVVPSGYGIDNSPISISVDFINSITFI
ncbi:hypothetical protein AAB109_29295 (plasmid) [Priestia megaterium]|uniref:hypothetical protein n=1 Tax=Priestia megaterium TaxID=1404 RepID=UPI0021D669A8|nr:hypothetical protein [Priestia megaterium]MCU7713025.1 hypothetical protein [Priestia megaterium]